MRAAVLWAPHEELRIEDVATARLLPSEVRVATRAVGLCHSDLHVIEGDVARPMPVVLGHEASGIVIEVGSDVSDVRIEDHVVVCFVVHCGACRSCLAGQPAMCSNREATMRRPDQPSRLSIGGSEVHQWTNVGGFAEELVLNRSAVTVIDDAMPLDLSALLGCAVATGVGSVRNVARVQPGDHVAVIGCGGVGLNICQGAAAAGAQTVIAIDQSDDKLALARQFFGATHVFNTRSHPAAAAEINALTSGGADHVFEAVGIPGLVPFGLGITARGRTLYAVGVFGDAAVIEVPAGHLHAGKGIRGVRLGSVNPQRDLPLLAGEYLAGRLDLDRLVSQRIPLDAINQGIAMLRSGTGARSIVVFDG